MAIIGFKPPPSHTKRYAKLDIDDVAQYDKIIYERNSVEARGQLPLWDELERSCPEKLVAITVQDTNSSFSDCIRVEQFEYEPQDLSLRDESDLSILVDCEALLIDITSLPHNIWAPLLKAYHSLGKAPKVLYVEPDEYKPHPTPATAHSFDLTESYRGMSPLPGFAQLSGPEDESKCIFIGLLGFEGNRPQHLFNNIEPSPRVIPIVGVPGFKIEMPQVTIACNSRLLSDNGAHSDIRYVRASCPFELYQTLVEVSKVYKDHYFYIAPVGTKPHALGAIWYAIKNAKETELMYGHPIRKQGRTRGIGLIHIYDLGDLSAA